MPTADPTESIATPSAITDKARDGMTNSPEERLAAMGVTLPEPAPSLASYVPTLISGGHLFISGQVPMGPDGLEFIGKIGRDLDLASGREAARLSAINLLAQAKSALGELSRVRQVTRLVGYINGIDSFAEPHKVLDAASDLIVDAFGDVGKHSRSVLVAANLPLNAATLVDAMMAID
jgi:enamine deaminase RidA (YjgF/YER057c/UK114 family)